MKAVPTRICEYVIDGKPGGQSTGIDGAGHWLMESHGVEVNRVVRDWLSGRATYSESGRHPLPRSAR